MSTTMQTTMPAVIPTSTAMNQNYRLTDDLVERVCATLEQGHYISVVCASVGISHSAFASWCRRGKTEYDRLLDPDVVPDPKELQYLNFYVAVEAAKVSAEIDMVAAWREHAETNWQAARDFLARRYPSRWGRKQGLTIELKEGDDLDTAIERELERLASGTEGGNAPAPTYEVTDSTVAADVPERGHTPALLSA